MDEGGVQAEVGVQREWVGGERKGLTIPHGFCGGFVEGGAGMGGGRIFL